MNDLPAEARAAGRAAFVAATGFDARNLSEEALEAVDAALETAAATIHAGEWAKLQPAIDRVQNLAAATQRMAVAHAAAAERERLVPVFWKLREIVRSGVEYPVECVPWSSVLERARQPGAV